MTVRVRSFGVVLATALGVIAWSNGATAILNSGVLWSVFGARLSRYPSFSLQAQLFAQSSSVRGKSAVALIGSRQFCAADDVALRGVVGGRPLLKLCLDGVSLNNVGEAVRAARQLGAAAMIIEADPLHFTNVAPTAFAPAMNMALWHRSFAPKAATIFSRSDTALVFDTLAAIASAPRVGATVVKMRERTALNLDFVFPTVLTQGAFSATTGSALSDEDWKTVWWLGSRTILPADASLELRVGYETLVQSGQFVEKVGHFVRKPAAIQLVHQPAALR